MLLVKMKQAKYVWKNKELKPKHVFFCEFIVLAENAETKIKDVIPKEEGNNDAIALRVSLEL